MEPTPDQIPTVVKGMREIADALVAPQNPEKKLRQVQGSFFEHNEETGEITGCCAFGRVSLHWFDTKYVLLSRESILDPIFDRVHIPRTLELRDPIRNWASFFDSIVMSLNDDKGWTFEQIAYWIRREADKMEQQAKKGETTNAEHE